MQAARYYGLHDLRVEDVPIPLPKDDQVQIKVAWCGICGSDLHEYTSGPIAIPMTDPHPLTGDTVPIIMGHEFSGTITLVGPDVKGSWKVGDRVVVEPVISCQKCYSCKIHRPNICNKLGFLGLSGGGGGLAEYICVNGNDAFLHALPDNVSLEYGAMVEPLAVAMHAVQASKLVAGQTALVVGGGPIGLFITQTLLSQGCSLVVVSEPSAVRRAAATHAGAHHVFDPREADVIASCRELTGGGDMGVDVSFECAGVQAGLDVALGALRPGGICVNVAIWDRKAEVDMVGLLMGEKTLTGVLCYHDNHPTALASLANGSINLDGFVTSKIAIKDVVKSGIEELLHHNERHVKILVSATGE
ncbi:hypothetical protein RQP46_002212 [Phenoliferia psychrophenolica]